MKGFHGRGSNLKMYLSCHEILHIYYLFNSISPIKLNGFPTLISRMKPIPSLGVLGGIFHTLQTLIEHSESK